MTIDVECPSCRTSIPLEDAPERESPTCPKCGNPLMQIETLGEGDELSEEDGRQATASRLSTRAQYLIAAGVVLAGAGIVIAVLFQQGVLDKTILYPVKAGKHKEAKEESIRLFLQLAASLERIKDEESAVREFQRINGICDRLDKIHKVRKDLPELPHDVRMLIAKKYETRVRQVSERLDRAVESMHAHGIINDDVNTMGRVHHHRLNMHFIRKRD